MIPNKKAEQPWSRVSLDKMYCSVLFICHENHFPITCHILYLLYNIDGYPHKGVYREREREKERDTWKGERSCCPAVYFQPPVY